jgi:hypothetical protein
MQILHNYQTITLFLTQAHYIQTKLDLFGITFRKLVAIPFEVNLPLSKDHALQFVVEMDIMRFVPHQQTVGSLTYAMVCIRHDLSFVVGAVFQHS